MNQPTDEIFAATLRQINDCLLRLEQAKTRGGKPLSAEERAAIRQLAPSCIGFAAACMERGVVRLN